MRVMEHAFTRRKSCHNHNMVRSKTLVNDAGGYARGRGLRDKLLDRKLSPRDRQENVQSHQGNGYKMWTKNDAFHRLDGPARIEKDGTEMWYREGLLHRDDDLPAIIRKNGDQEWWINDKRHREDGPALISGDGVQQYWMDGKKHRLDGPAIIYDDGTQQYWVDDKLHRDDGPAVIRADGTQIWYSRGELHRLDGPAVTHPITGPQEWWINDEQYTETEFQQYLARQRLNENLAGGHTTASLQDTLLKPR